MTQFDLDKPNIFIRFYIRGKGKQDEQVQFLYSNTAGIENFSRLLKESMFNNLFTQKEVLEKMVEKLTYNVCRNQYTGIDSKNWIGQNFSLDSEEVEEFNQIFEPWKKQLEHFVGKENLFEAIIPSKELDEFKESIKHTNILAHMHSGGLNQNEKFFNYVESYRSRVELNNELSVKETSTRKNKI